MRWVIHNAVMLISVAAAAISMILVPPDIEYLGYFDVPTLVTLFCMLACITALHRSGFFQLLAARITSVFSTLRGICIGFVIATAAASALFTNDMALIALLPLAYLVLSTAEQLKFVPFTFVLMTIAANLGGMITPFGSPQNLYLYSRFSIPAAEFMWLMVLPWSASMLVLLLSCLAIPKAPLSTAIASRTPEKPFETARTVRYLVLFAVTVGMVLRVVPLWAAAVIPLTILFSDRRALARLDWALLGTFAAFFVFAGNVARLPLVSLIIQDLLQGSVLLSSALLSQVISNVPSAILLAQFTENYAELLVGVNIGGVGTLVASLASLITLNELRRFEPHATRKFLWIFALVNSAFFVLLLGFSGALFSLGIYSGV